MFWTKHTPKYAWLCYHTRKIIISKNLNFLGNIEASVEQKHRQHTWTLAGNNWHFREPATPSEVVELLEFSVIRLLLSVRCRINTFLLILAALVFSEPKSEASDSSHQVMISIPNGSKLMPSLVEMRIRQNPPYKGGGTEIGTVPVGEMNENTIKILELLLGYTLHFFTPIELGGATVPEWTEEYSTQLFASLQTSTVSSVEKNSQHF